VTITASGFVDTDNVAADQRAVRIPGRATLAGGARHDEAFSRRTRARGFVHERHDCWPPGKRGRRSADCPRSTLPRMRGRAGRGLASRRSAAALAQASERFSSAQAALRAKERAPALPAPSIALKRSAPRPGRSAGGDDARAARERGYEPRPQEPRPLHQSAVTGDVPRTSGHCVGNANGD